MSSRKRTSRKRTSRKRTSRRRSSREPASRDLALLEVARQSIEYGVETGERMRIDASDYPEPLREPRATFVTLHREGRLRGCMGALEAQRPLVSDIAHNAHAAAFHDPRFAALPANELVDLEIHLSILSPLESLSIDDEADLLRQLRPGIDGLVLRDATHRGTFLPSVWENLAEPAEFLRELKNKAGLPTQEWSDDWEVLRYTVESIPRESE